MAMCKFCGKPFAWGSVEGKWVPLVPVGQEEALDRTYQDENGVLRAEHRAICTMAGGPTVRASRLARSIPAKDVLPAREVTPADPETGEIVAKECVEPIASPARKKIKGWAVEAGLGLGPKFKKAKKAAS